MSTITILKIADIVGISGTESSGKVGVAVGVGDGETVGVRDGIGVGEEVGVGVAVGCGV